MSEDPNKKTTKSPERFGAPRVEQTSGIDELEQKNQAERMRAATEERKLMVQNQSDKLATGLQSRVDQLPSELQGEAGKIAADAQAEIAKNEAELLAAQEATNKEIENSWFAYSEKMGGDGPINEETKLEGEIDNVLGPGSNFEQTESKPEEQKQKEATVYLEGLKAMLADPELPEEERAEIEEQIAGFEESLAVVEKTGQTIYEPAEAASDPSFTKASEGRQETSEDSVTKVLLAKKEIPQAAVELKEKIDQLAAEINKRGIRQVMFYGPQGFEFKTLGEAEINPNKKNGIDELLKNEAANFGVVLSEYPNAKPTESLSYLLAGMDTKKHKAADYLANLPAKDQAQAAYFLSIARAIEESGARTNTVRITAVIPQELAGKLEDLLEENPKVVQALLLKLLPTDLPKGQKAELLKPPKYISRFRPKQEVEESPQPAPAATTEPVQTQVTSRNRQATRVKAQGAQPATVPAPDVPQPQRQVASDRPQEARVETSKSREQLVAERRRLEREWEKEATKATERQMSKEDKKKYKQLLRETNEKKIKMKPEERRKLITDVGFTDADYQSMKTGSKPWTLNAIWKRLGEIDREIVEARPAEHALEPRPVASALVDTRPTSVVGEITTRPVVEDGLIIDEDAVKVQELADAARVLNDVLSKMDQYFKSSDTETLEKISKDPSMAKTIIEQGTQALGQWQGASVESVAAAMAPEYGTAEDMAKLSLRDLEAIKQHFIDNLIASIRLAEHVPGAKKAAAKVDLSADKAGKSGKTEEKKEKVDAMMSEISHAIKFDDAWYRDHEEETLKRWREAKNGAEIKVLLKEKLWPVADDMKLLKNADLDLIQEEVIEYLIPIAEAAKASAPSAGFAEKVKKHREETLKREINEAMKKLAELRQAVRRGEKGAENKLRSIGRKLDKLRKEKREMKK